MSPCVEPYCTQNGQNSNGVLTVLSAIGLKIGAVRAQIELKKKWVFSELVEVKFHMLLELVEEKSLIAFIVD